MHISKITLENFKSFKGNHIIELSEGINFFVGDNNTGKTTILKSIEFITTKGAGKDDFISNGYGDDDEVSVEIEIRGDDLDQLINNIDKLTRYKKFLIDDGSVKYLRIKRSSKEEDIVVGGKSKKLTIKELRLFNPKSKQFENGIGVDTTISALIDAQFVWSDIRNDEYQDFKNTKIVGKLLNSAINEFQSKDAWQNLKNAHKIAFEDKDFQKNLDDIGRMIEKILENQYGKTKIEFDFKPPEISDLTKSGDILVGEGDDKTSIVEKGTGLQRALVLSLIQTYGEIKRKEEGLSVPILFFIDEPETFLHPKAQDRLLNSLNNISKNSQVFITTHSPYLLKSFDKDDHKLFAFSKDGSFNKFDKQDVLDLFGTYSPSWGEINYFAFEMPSVEFHNELYGFLQAQAITEDENNYHENNFDNWLTGKGLTANKTYLMLKKDKTTTQLNRTLPTYIRNLIHHPENTCNTKFTDDELKESIDDLVNILRPSS